VLLQKAASQWPVPGVVPMSFCAASSFLLVLPRLQALADPVQPVQVFGV
jgi:hypothetical protein